MDPSGELDLAPAGSHDDVRALQAAVRAQRLAVVVVVLAVLVVIAMFAVTRSRQAQLLDARRVARLARETLMLVNSRDLSSRELRGRADETYLDSATRRRTATVVMVDSLAASIGRDRTGGPLLEQLRGDLARWETRQNAEGRTARQALPATDAATRPSERVRRSLAALILHAEHRYSTSRSAALTALWTMLAAVLGVLAVLCQVSAARTWSPSWRHGGGGSACCSCRATARSA